MKTGPSLPASVEERLSGWMQIQERRGQAPSRARPGAVITLSRACGCEAFAVALRLRELFGEGWGVFDKALIERVAQDEGISLSLLNGLGDATRALESFGFHPRGGVTQDEAFAKVAETVLKIAHQGHAVIVGRGGAILCRGLDNAFHFRLEAGRDWRLDSLVRRTGVVRAEAERLLRNEVRVRDAFFKERLGADLADPANYDAVFNNERHGAEQVAAAIHAYVTCAWPERA